MEAGSAYTGKLPRGCVLCRQGAKMVLLVSGECSTGCFYCPLSLEKKGRNVLFANEKRCSDDEDILKEAEMMRAKGTGITGGDPVACLDRTIHYIQMLKERFGKKHHIHLYTSSLDIKSFERLEKAGLDELRIHPSVAQWKKMSKTGLGAFKKRSRMRIGFEVPSLPGSEAALRSLLEYAQDVGLDFVNLNELEFSEGNWDQLKKRGFEIRDDVSSAARGSEELALGMISSEFKVPVHYCTSSFKDSVQLRNRLKRRALRVALPSDSHHRGWNAAQGRGGRADGRDHGLAA